jgi:hypothetical protein
MRKRQKMFEVRVPHGVEPGGDFWVLAIGKHHVPFTCPKNYGPGKRIRFNFSYIE